MKKTLKPLVADLYYTRYTESITIDGRHFKLDFNFKAPNLAKPERGAVSVVSSG